MAATSSWITINAHNCSLNNVTNYSLAYLNTTKNECCKVSIKEKINCCEKKKNTTSESNNTCSQQVENIKSYCCSEQKNITSNTTNIRKKKCCENYYLSIQVDTNYKIEPISWISSSLKHVVSYPLILIYDPIIKISEDTYYKFRPPPIKVASLFLRICCFRI